MSVCSYKVGTLKATETQSLDPEDMRVHVLYDHVPNKLVPGRSHRRTKWIFLTAVGLSKQQVEQFYDEGNIWHRLLRYFACSAASHSYCFVLCL